MDMHLEARIYQELRADRLTWAIWPVDRDKNLYVVVSLELYGTKRIVKEALRSVDGHSNRNEIRHC
jgi:hypothetical protein